MKARKRVAVVGLAGLCAGVALGAHAYAAATDAPSRSAKALPARCATSSLAVERIHSAAAANQWSLTFSFRNRGSRPCYLQGWPLVEGQTQRGAGEQALTATFGFRRSVIVLRPGRSDDGFVIAGSDLPPNGRPSCGPPYRYLLIGAPRGASFRRYSGWVPYGGKYFPTCRRLAVSPIVSKATLSRYQ